MTDGLWTRGEVPHSQNPDVSSSDVRFRELVEAAPDAILEVDRDGRIVLANEEAERLFRCGREVLLGKIVDDFVPERFRGEHQAHRDRYHVRPAKRPMGSGLDLWARRSDGSEFPVDIKLSPLDTENGPRVMCVIRDITERREAEEQIHNLNQKLEQRNREVERANQLKSEFLASMSHELRTPLNAIIGFSHLLGEENSDLSDKQRRFVERIATAARHLFALINDILDLSKIEAGRVDLAPQDFAVGPVIHEILLSFRPLAESKKLSFDTKLDSDLRIEADKTRFKQIVYNFVSNAVKFTPEGGAIAVQARVAGAFLGVEVTDTGMGIPPAEIGTIFAKFYQAGPTTKGIREGTGLGLAITKQLVELLGGRISVESQIGVGSRFTVELPLRPPLAGENTGTVRGALPESRRE